MPEADVDGSEAANALGTFLRARRRAADPADHALPDTGRRRVKGLRREEVAFLAGMSRHYYARLEQGQDRHPSDAVLDSLARVFALEPDATDLLHRLARPVPLQPGRGDQPEVVRPGLAQLVASWADQAAVVVGRYRDVLAANDLARLVNPGFVPGRNLLRDAFLDPQVRDVYLDWDDIIGGAVSSIRATAGDRLDDPKLRELIGELSLKSEAFRQVWARHDVHERSNGTKRYATAAGEIVLQYESFDVIGAGGQTLYVFMAEPGSRDAEVLGRLAALASGVSEASPRTRG